MRSDWWRFWDGATWRSWRADREGWSAFRAEAHALDERLGLHQQAGAHLAGQIAEAERRLAWIRTVGPQAVPIDTARSEPGLGAVQGVTLREMRTRKGRVVWVVTDYGPVYFTDRRIVFAGSKEVEFRYERITDLRRAAQGLLIGVSNRKRPHILAGPVEELSVTLEAARLVAEGGSPGAVERGRLDELHQSLQGQEADLEGSRRMRQALVVPSRPFSPAWLPGAAVLALAVAVTAVTSGGGATQEDAAGHNLVATSTTSVTTAGGTEATSLPATETTSAASTTRTPDNTSNTAGTTSTPPTSTSTTSTVPASTSSSTLGSPSEVETIGLPAGVVGVAAVLESVTDGDTLRVLVDGRSEPLRLIGINAPEENECLAAEADRYLAQLIEGRDLTLVTDVTDRDQYDRLLRYVWADDVFINEALVRTGCAIARRYPPDLAFADLLDDAQADAQRAQVGMWAPDACGPAATVGMVITHIEYDAPGDDNQNLNGEWVTLRNDGTAPVDLGGWVLKDESASHRHTFSTGFVLLADETVTVYTGCGEDTSKALYWCNQESAIWNNDGDTAYLLDPSGNIATYLSYSG